VGRRTQGGRDQAGVIPRALFDLFAQVSAAERPPVVRMSYLELYNEDLYDLLTETQHTLQARGPAHVHVHFRVCTRRVCV